MHSLFRVSLKRMGKTKTSKPDFVPIFTVFTFLSSFSGKTDYNKLSRHTDDW